MKVQLFQDPSHGVLCRSRGLLGDGRSRLESSPLEAVLPRLSRETNPHHVIENNRLEEIVLTLAKFN
jgi:hypothetical protein